MAYQAFEKCISLQSFISYSLITLNHEKTAYYALIFYRYFNQCRTSTDFFRLALPGFFRSSQMTGSHFPAIGVAKAGIHLEPGSFNCG